MNYDFDKVTDRRNTDSVKWNVAEHELPMWVADMDFPAAPPVAEVVRRRSALGIFGYQYVTEEWKKAYAGWWKRRHDFALEEDWLLFCTGVVPAISSILRMLTLPGEKVLIQPPVYHVFFHSILDNGRQVQENPLQYDGERYTIDFEDLERGLADPRTTLMILCSPHNPAGRIWSREELAEIGRLCARHHVTVISDEIHCDLTDPGCGYIPFASVSEECRRNSITCVAPTKAFNLAGLKTAAVIVPDEALRAKIRQGLHTDGLADANAFAVDAAVAAFTEGDSWLDALREYLYFNKKAVIEFLAEELPQVKVTPAQATYLLWLDCRAVTGAGKEMAGFIREKTGLFLSSGDQFGSGGAQFLRMNIACPRSTLMDGLRRLREGITAYEAHAARER